MTNDKVYTNPDEVKAFLVDAVLIYCKSHFYKVWRKPDNTLWLEYNNPTYAPQNPYWFRRYESYASRNKRDHWHLPTPQILLNKTENKVYTDTEEVLIAAQKILGGTIKVFPLDATQRPLRPPEFRTAEKYLVMDEWKRFGYVYRAYKMDPDEAAGYAGLTFEWPKDYRRRYLWLAFDGFCSTEYEEAKAFLADAVIVYTRYSGTYKVWRKPSKSLWLEYELPDDLKRYELRLYNRGTDDDDWPLARELVDKKVN